MCKSCMHAVHHWNDFRIRHRAGKRRAIGAPMCPNQSRWQPNRPANQNATERYCARRSTCPTALHHEALEGPKDPASRQKPAVSVQARFPTGARCRQQGGYRLPPAASVVLRCVEDPERHMGSPTRRERKDPGQTLKRRFRPPPSRCPMMTRSTWMTSSTLLPKP